MNNKFNVWDANGTNPYIASEQLAASESNFIASGKIYADIFNGILKEVSLVTVGILEALAIVTTADTSSMEFDNDKTLNAVKTNIQTMLGGLKTPALKTPINVAIKNNSSTTLATVQTDCSSDIILTLPASVAIDISGNAYSADRIKNTVNIKLDAGAGSIQNNNVTIASGTTINLDLPQNIGGNAATATKATKADSLDMGTNPQAVGGLNNPVYISAQGKPIATNWNSERYNKLVDAGLYKTINAGVGSTSTSFDANNSTQNPAVYQLLTKVDGYAQRFVLCLVSFKLKDSSDVVQLTFCIDKISRNLGPNDSDTPTDFRGATSNPVIYNNKVYELQTAKTSTTSLEIKLHDVTSNEYRVLKCATFINL